jgi:hypothetical protein
MRQERTRTVSLYVARLDMETSFHVGWYFNSLATYEKVSDGTPRMIRHVRHWGDR